MEIIFNKDTSKLYDFFMSLYLSNNYEEAETELKQIELIVKKEHKEYLTSIIDKCGIEKEKIDFYFSEDFYMQPVFISFNEFFKHSTIKDALECISKLDRDTLRKRLVENILNTKNEVNYSEEVKKEVEEIYKIDQEILKLVKDLDINKDLKWNIFCFIDDPESYRDDYIDIMKKFLPIFEELYIDKVHILDEFNSYIEENLNNKGLNFIKNKTRNMINYDPYKKIYITTSYVHCYGIRIRTTEDSLYIGLGKDFENTIELMAGRDTNIKEKNIGVFKNLSDNTRFEIIKLLGEDKQYFNKEIAEILGITGATVSYHMNYLMSAGIIRLDKKEKRNVYTLNKDTIRESIEFLVKELNL